MFVCQDYQKQNIVLVCTDEFHDNVDITVILFLLSLINVVIYLSVRGVSSVRDYSVVYTTLLLLFFR